MGLHANKDGVIQEPTASWLEFIAGSFEAPPTSTHDLVSRMVSSRKELARDAISLTAVIGSVMMSNSIIQQGSIIFLGNKYSL